MPPIASTVILGRIESAPAPFFLRPFARKMTKGVRNLYLEHTIKPLFNYLDGELGKSEWLAGAEFTAADIIMRMPIEGVTQRVESGENSKTLNAFWRELRRAPPMRAHWSGAGFKSMCAFYRS